MNFLPPPWFRDNFFIYYDRNIIVISSLTRTLLLLLPIKLDSVDLGSIILFAVIMAAEEFGPPQELLRKRRFTFDVHSLEKDGEPMICVEKTPTHYRVRVLIDLCSRFFLTYLMFFDNWRTSEQTEQKMTNFPFVAPVGWARFHIKG